MENEYHNTEEQALTIEDYQVKNKLNSIIFIGDEEAWHRMAVKPTHPPIHLILPRFSSFNFCYVVFTT